MTETTSTAAIRRGVSRSRDPIVAAAEIYDALFQPDLELAVFYCSADYDLDVLGRELHSRFGDVNLIGCTTAGEIGLDGYVSGSCSGFSLSSESFSVATVRLDNLKAFEFQAGEAAGVECVRRLRERHAGPVTKQNSFGLLLVDGMSMREEAVVGTVYRGLDGVPLIGGSAADGLRFASTHIYHDGRFHDNSAVVVTVATELPFRVFKTEHFAPAPEKIVVTKADASRRIVYEINGEPAGREYARVLGLDPEAPLTPLTFATHPVLVRLGGHYFVRSIQKVNDDESLSFYCAIDEGIVLTVADPSDIIDNLAAKFRDVRAEIGPPRLVIGFDCVLRTLELNQKCIVDRASAIATENNVEGFSTYGEQFNAMHANQTFTGVAIGDR